jgi:hydrogenase maturation protease
VRTGDTTSRILVAGIGNIFLGDDGFGSEVVRRVPALAHADVVDYGIRGMHLAYDLLDGRGALVLVDAVPDRGSPGTLHVFEAAQDIAAARLDAHAMDPAAVFACVSALGGTMPYTVVVGCEIASADEGIGLSDAVAAAVPAAVRAVQDVVADVSARLPVEG